MESLKYLSASGNVLDLGAGLGTDSKYLSEHGYIVTAVDSDPIATEYFQNKPDKNITFVKSSFVDYDFPQDEFILINAQYALPFIRDKNELISLFGSIKGSLKKDGIFVGQLFGERDSWQHLALLTREEAEALFSDMQMIKFQEQDGDGKTASGDVKHWHVFHIIAQKK